MPPVPSSEIHIWTQGQRERKIWGERKSLKLVNTCESVLALLVVVVVAAAAAFLLVKEMIMESVRERRKGRSLERKIWQLIVAIEVAISKGATIGLWLDNNDLAQGEESFRSHPFSAYKSTYSSSELIELERAEEASYKDHRLCTLLFALPFAPLYELPRVLMGNELLSYPLHGQYSKT